MTELARNSVGKSRAFCRGRPSRRTDKNKSTCSLKALAHPGPQATFSQ
jgi:hypothetical protein